MRRSERGNVFFFILLAIALIALVTAALRMSGQEGANIDRETVLVNASQVRQYAGELERAVITILNNGASESDIRFAHPDAPSDYGLITDTPSFQVFSRSGGAAAYRRAPSGINDGSLWEFFGHTHLPQTGSAKADLIAVLPNVTTAFCAKVNEMNGLTGQPDDTGGSSGNVNCVHGATSQRFTNTTQYAASPNTTNEASFSTAPAREACVRCTIDGSYHFYHVLLSR